MHLATAPSSTSYGKSRPMSCFKYFDTMLGNLVDPVNTKRSLAIHLPLCRRIRLHCFSHTLLRLRNGPMLLLFIPSIRAHAIIPRGFPFQLHWMLLTLIDCLSATTLDRNFVSINCTELASTGCFSTSYGIRNGRSSPTLCFARFLRSHRTLCF